jgi:hypothetical protein
VLKTDPSLVQAHYDLGLLYLFAESVPGSTSVQAAERAIAELEQFKKKKPRSATGTPDDTDELITRAKTKKALAEAKEQEAAAQPGAPAPTTPAAPPAAQMPPVQGGATK